MDRTKCWKCNTTLAEGGCPSCDASMVELIKESINRAKACSDAMEDSLDAFKKRIREHRTQPARKGIKDIGFAINTLCNIIDLLEQGNSHLISDEDLNEVQEKSQQIIKCVETLRKFKLASGEQTNQ